MDRRDGDAVVDLLDLIICKSVIEVSVGTGRMTARQKNVTSHVVWFPNSPIEKKYFVTPKPIDKRHTLCYNS